MSEMKSKVIDILLMALLSVVSAAVGMLWTIKADAAAVSERFAKVEAVADEKINAVRMSQSSAQAATEKRLDRIETKLDDMPNMVARALKGN